MIRICAKQTMNTAQGRGRLEVDFAFEKAEFITLFGASGAGKTTLLRILAGLLEPEEGYIEFEGEVWLDTKKKFSLPPQQRRVGFVFQEPTVFPNMTVRENLAFALLAPEESYRIDETLVMMGLEELAHQKSDRLSGGQKQRVALARALVNSPKILLLDEPLSALDIDLRLKLQDEMVAIYQKTKITTVLVSHDIFEVFKLSGKIFVLEEGRIIKSGHPQDVFVSENLSGKFKFTGEIIEIQKDGVVYILAVRIGNNITKVVATDEEIATIKLGSKVMVSTKAFNPIILPWK